MIKIFRFLAMCTISLSVLCLAVICAVPAWAQQKPSQPNKTPFLGLAGVKE